MNCKQVEGLLPLYAGHDLDEKRERLIADHLPSCAACAHAAEEYQQTRLLLHEFAPPTFNDDLYAVVRQNVRRRLETESRPPSVRQLIAGWLQPRWAWAPAALLIAVSVFGVYLLVRPGAGPRQVGRD